MSNYEITFIVDPVLSGDEIKGTAQTYVDLLQNEGSTIVHVDEMGLRQLAYPINKRSSGVYFCVEFQNETGNVIDQIELAFRRDERIMRFLTLRLDKYGVKYNDDKRKGLIGKKKKPQQSQQPQQPATPSRPENKQRSEEPPRQEKSKPAPVVAEPVAVPEAIAPVAVPEVIVPVAAAMVAADVVSPVSPANEEE